jgi:sugar/nucleoside kinase (ribokinase family)
LNEAGGNMTSLKVTAGFDGFVDQIVKIIRYKETGEPLVFFNSKKEFADYIYDKEGTSFSLELQEQFTKLGGNMPIMANALATLGLNVNCVGAMGYPSVHPVFQSLSSNCTLYSFADPGFSTAYEFNDGKMMMGHFADLHTTGWNEIKTNIGLNTIIDLYKQSALLCFVNWSEIDASTSIWKGIIEEVLPGNKQHPIAFFDLSDCTKRTDDSILEALQLIQTIGQYARTALGMNKNEARHICNLLNGKPVSNLTLAAETIYRKLQAAILVVHSSKEAIAFDTNGLYQHNSYFIEAPRISTGAGDNFNAGFCAAQLLQLDLKSSIIFANAVAGLYVKNGKSPNLHEVKDFLISADNK